LLKNNIPASNAMEIRSDTNSAMLTAALSRPMIPDAHANNVSLNKSGATKNKAGDIRVAAVQGLVTITFPNIVQYWMT